MMNLNRIWYQKHWLAFFLRPFSWLFRFIISVRRLLYRFHFLKSKRFHVPIIVVGNLTAGGTGKTPLVLYLSKLLKSQGYIPGIVSRGYGGSNKMGPQFVTLESNTNIVGDEAVMLVQKTGCPMVIDSDRVAAVEKLLSESDCNVVISDDGLQHYAMHRDIEIAVVDGTRLFGNACCLPAGPLREPLSRLRTVDFIVSNGAAMKDSFTMRLNPGDAYNVANPNLRMTLEECRSREWQAVAGIGNPDRFFFQLEHLGLKIHAHSYPDHFHFSKKDIDFGDDVWVMMTEKDAVKCRDFADKRHWCLPVEATLDPYFEEVLLERMA